jgi:UDP:flavonoid glycosyltransferase YjiC (YdhE family)
MRVLITCHPGLSHLDTMSSLTAPMEEAGHTVAYATARSFVGTVEKAGFEAFAAGRDWHMSRPETLRELHSAPARAGGIAVFAGLAQQGMVDDLISLAGRWKPDVIVRETMEFGGWIAAESLGIPVATSNLSHFILPAPLLSMFTGDTLTRQLPAQYGLDPDPQLERLYDSPYLHAAPSSLDLPGWEPPSRVFRYRSDAFESTDGSGTPTPGAGSPASQLAWLDDFRELPIVHVSLGTVWNHTEFGHRANEVILEGLRDLPVNVVLVVGPEGDPQSYGARPDNVRIEKFIAPYQGFLSQCQILVSHGGYRTVVQATVAGLPMCFAPLKGDQPVVASRFAELGLGLNLAAVPGDRRPFPVIDLDHFQPLQVRDAVQRVLADATYRGNVEALRDETAALPPAAAAVSWLADVVGA